MKPGLVVNGKDIKLIRMNDDNSEVTLFYDVTTYERKVTLPVEMLVDSANFGTQLVHYDDKTSTTYYFTLEEVKMLVDSMEIQ